MKNDSKKKFLTAIGLMSGTSLDGVDAAIIITDGTRIKKYGPTLYRPFPENLQKRLADLIKSPFSNHLSLENELTIFHAEVVKDLLKQNSLKNTDIDIIGFHGQTILHKPREGITWQIGNGSLLAHLTKISVVCDFRRKDVAAGGEGAPLVPIYHKAILQAYRKPVAILNIGGISNITFLHKNSQSPLIAFDLGPANSIINDYCKQRFNENYDNHGERAAQGIPNKEIISKWLEHEYFLLPPPKSLDRNAFHDIIYSYTKGEYNPYDIIATLTAFAARAISYGIQRHLPETPKKIFIAGGGCKNKSLINFLKGELSNIEILSIQNLGLDPDFIEAQAFAFLSVRSLKNLAITFPATTKTHKPLCGGALYQS